jgi:hypothetical protein
MPPIALTDAQLTAVFDAAKPLPRASRDAFLLDLAAALQGISDPGDGDVSRAIRTVQRKHFDPPNLTDGRAQPHPGRGPRQDRVTSRRPADYGHDTDTKESCLPRVSSIGARLPYQFDFSIGFSRRPDSNRDLPGGGVDF